MKHGTLVWNIRESSVSCLRIYYSYIPDIVIPPCKHVGRDVFMAQLYVLLVWVSLKTLSFS